MKAARICLAAMLGASLAGGRMPAQHEHGQAKDAMATTNAPYLTTDGYPLDTCIVSGKALPKQAATATVAGRTYKTCSKECTSKIEKDPDGFAKKLDAAIVAAQKPFYPLATCVVSGKALDSMGGPREVVVEDRLVLLCCKGCEKEFADGKTAMVRRLTDAAYESQKASFQGKACPVSGDEHPATPVDVMHGYALIRLCCEDCLDKVNEAPNAIAAKSSKTGRAEKPGHDHGKSGEGHDHGDHGRGAPAGHGHRAAGGCGQGCGREPPLDP